MKFATVPQQNVILQLNIMGDFWSYETFFDYDKDFAIVIRCSRQGL